LEEIEEATSNFTKPELTADEE